MYTLRTIFPSGEELNEFLGKKFTVIDKATSKDLFDELKKHHGLSDDVHWVVGDENDKLHFLHLGNRYYVVSDTGNTFKAIR